MSILAPLVSQKASGKKRKEKKQEIVIKIELDDKETYLPLFYYVKEKQLYHGIQRNYIAGGNDGTAHDPFKDILIK